MKAKCLVCLLAGLSTAQPFLFAQRAGSGNLSPLISRFDSTRDLEAKERLLNAITTEFPNAGPALLRLAETTGNVDTKWMAIRGIGTLSYEGAVPFLVESLHSEHPYVRANSARALGDMKAQAAEGALVALLRGEQDDGVIEQTSLALRMLGARDAVPVLKSKASHPSVQTRVWILQAIGDLGSRGDVPFLAARLYQENPAVSMSAAQAIETIMGIDFGFPKGQGPSSPEEGLRNARLWWAAHKSSWGPHRPRIEKVPSMRFCATALGLLLAPSILYAQEPQPPDMLQFLLVLPEGIPLDGVQIQYFASGPQGGDGGFLKAEPEKNAYDLSVPGTRVNVIAYMPGCQFDTLELTAEAPTTQELDCRPLASVALSGRIAPKGISAGKNVGVEASYLAFWAHEFFGIADGMVDTFKVATAAPDEDGTFELLLPDFADDAVTTRWRMNGRWQFLLREVRTGNILAFLKPTGPNSELEVRSSYSDEVTFAAVRNH